MNKGFQKIPSICKVRKLTIKNVCVGIVYLSR